MSGCILKEDTEGITLRVRVQPGASRDEIVGPIEGALRIRITSPPVEGAANKACIRFLAKKLHVAKSRISILKGEQSRDKVLFFQGLCATDLQGILL
jgi:uncharacterized protein (TIGR00251 family)